MKVNRQKFTVADPGGGVGEVTIFFKKKEVYEQELSIKRVRKLSQNTGNGHNFRDSSFLNF